uniref:Uncharacterized protein n=1 Tax=Chromera velia CCMP2878 TaxID=1169474 RepID=A0A0G4FSK9_9ALVE|eukprot:Cvel_18566.t1-p1 / transcript=Cvel_18566.t1 / gene=Cvel_18566 / organism=Chromera_velia_CCMP2878 / gene_product=hypothetical protein / transcript_product=hypothetical protein / location=Cvel_scaffold1547:12646-18618(+) / protein_length=1515 / sequence_SO=supercontig / SO=protein_coding / is_pseudo=false
MSGGTGAAKSPGLRPKSPRGVSASVAPPLPQKMDPEHEPQILHRVNFSTYKACEGLEALEAPKSFEGLLQQSKAGKLGEPEEPFPPGVEFKFSPVSRECEELVSLEKQADALFHDFWVQRQKYTNAQQQQQQEQSGKKRQRGHLQEGGKGRDDSCSSRGRAKGAAQFSPPEEPLAQKSKQGERSKLGDEFPSMSPRGGGPASSPTAGSQAGFGGVGGMKFGDFRTYASVIAQIGALQKRGPLNAACVTERRSAKPSGREKLKKFRVEARKSYNTFRTDEAKAFQSLKNKHIVKQELQCVEYHTKVEAARSQEENAEIRLHDPNCFAPPKEAIFFSDLQGALPGKEESDNTWDSIPPNVIPLSREIRHSERIGSSTAKEPSWNLHFKKLRQEIRKEADFLRRGPKSPHAPQAPKEPAMITRRMVRDISSVSGVGDRKDRSRSRSPCGHSVLPSDAFRGGGGGGSEPARSPAAAAGRFPDASPAPPPFNPPAPPGKPPGRWKDQQLKSRLHVDTHFGPLRDEPPRPSPATATIATGLHGISPSHCGGMSVSAFGQQSPRPWGLARPGKGASTHAEVVEERRKQEDIRWRGEEAKRLEYDRLWVLRENVLRALTQQQAQVVSAVLSGDSSGASGGGMGGRGQEGEAAGMASSEVPEKDKRLPGPDFRVPPGDPSALYNLLNSLTFRGHYPIQGQSPAGASFGSFGLVPARSKGQEKESVRGSPRSNKEKDQEKEKEKKEKEKGNQKGTPKNEDAKEKEKEKEKKQKEKEKQTTKGSPKNKEKKEEKEKGGRCSPAESVEKDKEKKERDEELSFMEMKEVTGRGGNEEEFDDPFCAYAHLVDILSQQYIQARQPLLPSSLPPHRNKILSPETFFDLFVRPPGGWTKDTAACKAERVFFYSRSQFFSQRGEEKPQLPPSLSQNPAPSKAPQSSSSHVPPALESLTDPENEEIILNNSYSPDALTAAAGRSLLKCGTIRSPAGPPAPCPLHLTVSWPVCLFCSVRHPPASAESEGLPKSACACPWHLSPKLESRSDNLSIFYSPQVRLRLQRQIRRVLFRRLNGREVGVDFVKEFPIGEKMTQRVIDTMMGPLSAVLLGLGVLLSTFTASRKEHPRLQAAWVAPRESPDGECDKANMKQKKCIFRPENTKEHLRHPVLQHITPSVILEAVLRLRRLEGISVLSDTEWTLMGCFHLPSSDILWGDMQWARVCGPTCEKALSTLEREEEKDACRPAVLEMFKAERDPLCASGGAGMVTKWMLQAQQREDGEKEKEGGDEEGGGSQGSEGCSVEDGGESPEKGAPDVSSFSLSVPAHLNPRYSVAFAVHRESCAPSCRFPPVKSWERKTVTGERESAANDADMRREFEDWGYPLLTKMFEEKERMERRAVEEKRKAERRREKAKERAERKKEEKASAEGGGGTVEEKQKAKKKSDEETEREKEKAVKKVRKTNSKASLTGGSADPPALSSSAFSASVSSSSSSSSKPKSSAAKSANQGKGGKETDKSGEGSKGSGPPGEGGERT